MLHSAFSLFVSLPFVEAETQRPNIGQIASGEHSSSGVYWRSARIYEYSTHVDEWRKIRLVASIGGKLYI